MYLDRCRLAIPWVVSSSSSPSFPHDARVVVTKICLAFLSAAFSLRCSRLSPSFSRFFLRLAALTIALGFPLVISIPPALPTLSPEDFLLSLVLTRGEPQQLNQPSLQVRASKGTEKPLFL